MEPIIRMIAGKKLVGKRLLMSFAEDKTFELWRGFMPRRNEIRNRLTNDFISLQVFDKDFSFKDFDANRVFVKWAVVEVEDHEDIPDDMEAFSLQGGEYAVFIHQGPASEGEKTFRYIFSTWLPASDYVLDNRPHFEVLGDKYKQESPDSEEEIWIPVKRKDDPTP